MLSLPSFPFSALPVNNILPCLKIGVDEFKLSLPLLVSLRNPFLRTRHLNAIEVLTAINVIQDPLCTVAKVLESSYFEHRADISKISIQVQNSHLISDTPSLFQSFKQDMHFTE